MGPHDVVRVVGGAAITAVFLWSMWLVVQDKLLGNCIRRPLFGRPKHRCGVCGKWLTSELPEDAHFECPTGHYKLVTRDQITCFSVDDQLFKIEHMFVSRRDDTGQWRWEANPAYFDWDASYRDVKEACRKYREQLGKKRYELHNRMVFGTTSLTRDGVLAHWGRSEDCVRYLLAKAHDDDLVADYRCGHTPTVSVAEFRRANTRRQYTLKESVDSEMGFQFYTASLLLNGERVWWGTLQGCVSCLGTSANDDDVLIDLRREGNPVETTVGEFRKANKAA